MTKPTPSMQTQVERIADEQIRERAYDIWERHHRPEGYEMHFWFMAKRELMAERQTRIITDKTPDEGAAS